MGTHGRVEHAEIFILASCIALLGSEIVTLSRLSPSESKLPVSGIKTPAQVTDSAVRAPVCGLISADKPSKPEGFLAVFVKSLGSCA